MNISNLNIEIPAWISSRSYFVGGEKSRSFITNERKHEYIQLDGVSSDLWFYLINDNETELKELVKKHKLENDVVDFILELFDLGLVAIKGRKNNNQQSDEPGSISQQEDEDFVEERNEWLWQNHFMSSILLELTYRCNLKCIHCYNPKNISNVEIDFETAKKIIDEAYDLGACEVTLTGGESTTYTHFIELCTYIRKKRMGLTIFTNGQRLFDDPELYSELLKLYPHQVSISLYSNNNKTHNRVTDVDGSFEKSQKIITSLCRDNVMVQIKNFLLNFACRDCVLVQKYADEVGAINVTDISLIPTIEGDKKTLQFELNDDDLFFLFSNKESPLYVGNNPKLFDYEKNKDTSPCLGGFNGLCVTPNCDFKICVSVPSVLTNYKQTTLKSLWEGAINKEKSNPLFQWQMITNSDLKECYKYDYCKFCHYCAGMAELENGYLKKSNILCKQAKAKQKAYEYLKKKGEI